MLSLRLLARTDVSHNTGWAGWTSGAQGVITTAHGTGAPREPGGGQAPTGTSTDAEPTYPEVGATLRGERPTGYRHDVYEARLGKGQNAFIRASTGLQSWKTHQVPGVSVFPTCAPIESGATVVVTLGTPWLALAAPCRIVGAIDESDRWGFAYGTLPGHPEKGEESFTVSIGDDDTVLFRILAFSRPGDRVTRLAGPVGRAVQAAGTTGYLKALQRFVDRRG
jgi:uncharacterized protein (UPF0548 family)